MNMTDIVIVAAVVVAVAVAAVRLVGTATGKRDCCSGDVKDPGAGKGDGRSFAKAEVTDTDPAHYPYVTELGIGGMSCEHCVASVTNALESIEGCWAEVTLAGGRALLRSKAPIDEAGVRSVVERAGYRLVSFSEK